MNDHSGLRVVEERSRLPADALRALSHRLDGYRKSIDLGEGWERGVPGDWLDALLGDWRVFDTDALQRQLDALRQQRAEVGGHVAGGLPVLPEGVRMGFGFFTLVPIGEGESSNHGQGARASWRNFEYSLPA